MHTLFYFLISLFIVAFGQPSFNESLSILAGFVGYVLFFRVLVESANAKTRFWLGTLWFSIVQAVQLFWFLSHPFLYIYPLYLFFVITIGVEFGLLCLLIDKRRASKIGSILALSGLWTLIEWSRLFFLSGYSWNPIGLSLASNILSLQVASLAGVYGLSFLVMFTNLLAVRMWLKGFSYISIVTYLVVALSPFVFGFFHLKQHEAEVQKKDFLHLDVALLHTSFPVEEATISNTRKSIIIKTLDEWKLILKALKSNDKSIDLIVLPEYAVFCGTYTCVFPLEAIKTMFKEHLGEKSLESFPELMAPWAILQGKNVLVNNAFIAKSLANFYQAGFLIGLEDVDQTEEGIRKYVSAALYFSPHDFEQIERYEKRVLVPLGEYIPFEFCKKMAAGYGIHSSFTPGECAKIFECKKVLFGASICYEETFGDMMRENRDKGAELLINLTSDAWYPHSPLADQHFYHSRLRTVENGFPLIRSSNLGVTGAIDSLGKVIVEHKSRPQDAWSADVIYASIPLYTYHTPYSFFGDKVIIFLSIAALLFFFKLNL